MEWIDRAKGTVFDGKAWVTDFSTVVSDEQKAKIISEVFGDRFMWNSYGIFQEGNASWEEKYGLLSLFRENSHLMYIPVKESDFETSSLVNNRSLVKDILKEEKVYAHLKWLSENEIKVKDCLKMGDMGDEDGFGIEPDTWMTGILYRDGSIRKHYVIYE